MKIMNMQQEIDFILSISKDEVVEMMDIDKDIYIQFVREAAEIELTEKQREFIYPLLDDLKDQLEGIELILIDGRKQKELADRLEVPAVEGLAAAVLPNPHGREVMAIDVDGFCKLLEDADREDVEKFFMEMVGHELVHIRQMRRGDLVYLEDGSIQWNGWNPKIFNHKELVENFQFPRNLNLLNNEIKQKPWEAEAYGLSHPIEGLARQLDGDVMEHILQNWHNFGDVREASVL